MTCIIGVVERGRVYIGGDSAASSGYELRATRLPKVFQRGEFLIGYTTSFRMGQLLEYCLQLDPQSEKETDLDYLVRVFIEAVRKSFKEHGFAKIENSVDSGGEFLLGYRKHLYSVDSDFQINEFSDGVEAVGAGEDYALGALLALKRFPPRKRILMALEISARLSKYVCPPFIVIEAK